ncbi:MAG: radical SAM protein [Candidatus Omnitrophica bacterium]|nr:radical SAM protein [Candidatus Omnitrophota bacterium]
MKVLLIVSHHRILNYGYISSEDSDYPLGLGYVAAVIEKSLKPEFIDIVDFQLTSQTIESFKDQLKRKQYDLVGISVATPTYRPGLNLSKIVKETLPHSLLVVGGPFTGMNPGQMLEICPEVDVEFIGESEETIPELFDAVLNRKPLSGVEGIAYREDAEVRINPRRAFIKDLDSIPYPKRDIFKLYEYVSLPGQFFKLPILAMITSRGCPFRCNFCEDYILWGGRCRFRSAENVYAEMEELVKRYKAREIKFFDDTFTASRRRTVELCELLIRRKLNIIWRICTRIDTVDEELFSLMYRAGLRSVNFGIESGSDRILKAMNKGFTKEQVRRAVSAARKAGLETKGSFMLNYPGDTKETTLETLAFVDELQLDFVGYNLFNPLMGRQLKDYVEKNYRINEKAWNNPDVSPVNTIFFYQDSLPEEFLTAVYKKAMRNYYLKPRSVLRTIKRIRNLDMAKSYFKGFKRLFGLGLSRGS